MFLTGMLSGKTSNQPIVYDKDDKDSTGSHGGQLDRRTGICLRPRGCE